ncbi:hypothetical protein Bca4012_082459 [Brassica carinata]|uniref:Uncharacterized protein n=1 Tax=Brassica carinata TaxID=52824 RepID=A0A8X7VBT6_BRACI|nr:hypothetical protein Bca52824_028192 [Brassica carinata]
MAMKSMEKSQLSTCKSPVAIYFNDISPGTAKSEMLGDRFREYQSHKEGTNTRDRVKFRIHKKVTDLFRSLDVVKQITSITIEPGIEDKFNTSES